VVGQLATRRDAARRGGQERGEHVYAGVWASSSAGTGATSIDAG
jgi:hypothetical protein